MAAKKVQVWMEHPIPSQINSKKKGEQEGQEEQGEKRNKPIALSLQGRVESHRPKQEKEETKTNTNPFGFPSNTFFLCYTT